MTKHKNFRDWVNTDWEDTQYLSEDDSVYKKKDKKRTDSNKRKIQNARKRKAKDRNSFFED